MGFRAGVIEGGVTRIFSGLQIRQAGLIESVVDAGKIVAKEGLKKTARKEAVKAVKGFLDSESGKMLFDWFGEGLEEGLIATLDQVNRVTMEVASGRMNTEEAMERYYNPWAVFDAFYAGMLGGAVGSSPFVLGRGMSAVGSKFTLFDRLELKDKKRYLEEQLRDPNVSEEDKKKARAELVKVHEDANRLARRDIEFYAQMEQEDQAEIVRLNGEISNKRRQLEPRIQEQTRPSSSHWPTTSVV